LGAGWHCRWMPLHCWVGSDRTAAMPPAKHSRRSSSAIHKAGTHVMHLPACSESALPCGVKPRAARMLPASTHSKCFAHCCCIALGQSGDDCAAATAAATGGGGRQRHYLRYNVIRPQLQTTSVPLPNNRLLASGDGSCCLFVCKPACYLRARLPTSVPADKYAAARIHSGGPQRGRQAGGVRSVSIGCPVHSALQVPQTSRAVSHADRRRSLQHSALECNSGARGGRVTTKCKTLA
jgi:hypothetical protein